MWNFCKNYSNKSPETFSFSSMRNLCAASASPSDLSSWILYIQLFSSDFRSIDSFQPCLPSLFLCLLLGKERFATLCLLNWNYTRDQPLFSPRSYTYQITSLLLKLFLKKKKTKLTIEGGKFLNHGIYEEKKLTYIVVKCPSHHYTAHRLHFNTLLLHAKKQVLKQKLNHIFMWPLKRKSMSTKLSNWAFVECPSYNDMVYLESI